jgi:CTP synthase
MVKKNQHKYVFVVGGVMSGVGKGVTTASIGTILKSKGYKVSLIKADPYLNVDAGTMNPTEHGEVFVMDSGLETDQDMGNYERFLDVSLPNENYMTNGMVFKHVIDKERALGYKGKCVEPVFHITEEILRRLRSSAQKTDAEITVVEVGGTIGEYQNAIFLEAARVLKQKNPRDVMFVMVSYLPVPKIISEMKTKPTQNAVRQLNSYGINPDIIVARSEVDIDKKRKEKIARATGIDTADVISAPDIKSIYEIPVNFEKDGLSQRILSHFGLRPRKGDLKDWEKMLEKSQNPKGNVRIAVIGKYFDTGDFVISDVYISVIEALKFSAFSNGVEADLTWVNSKDIESGKVKVEELSKFDGVLVPGGFGSSGIEGIISAITYARENKIPYFGICYGMQLMVVEFARNVAGLKTANTAEIDPEAEHVLIDIMPEQKKLLLDQKMGGSMRLGSYPAKIKKGTIAAKAYKSEDIDERHRHRYEVNPEYVERMQKAGMTFSGTSPDGRLMEIAELPKSVHPFYIAVQFHPEFKARPLSPHPIFSEFIKAAKQVREK